MRDLSNSSKDVSGIDLGSAPSLNDPVHDNFIRELHSQNLSQQEREDLFRKHWEKYDVPQSAPQELDLFRFSSGHSLPLTMPTVASSSDSTLAQDGTTQIGEQLEHFAPLDSEEVSPDAQLLIDILRQPPSEAFLDASLKDWNLRKFYSDLANSSNTRSDLQPSEGASRSEEPNAANAEASTTAGITDTTNSLKGNEPFETLRPTFDLALGLENIPPPRQGLQASTGMAGPKASPLNKENHTMFPSSFNEQPGLSTAITYHPSFTHHNDLCVRLSGGPALECLPPNGAHSQGSSINDEGSPVQKNRLFDTKSPILLLQPFTYPPPDKKTNVKRKSKKRKLESGMSKSNDVPKLDTEASPHPQSGDDPEVASNKRIRRIENSSPPSKGTLDRPFAELRDTLRLGFKNVVNPTVKANPYSLPSLYVHYQRKHPQDFSEDMPETHWPMIAGNLVLRGQYGDILRQIRAASAGEGSTGSNNRNKGKGKESNALEKK